MKRPLVALASLILAACGGGPNVGSPCTASSDCSMGQYCNTSVAGGYCTRGCTFEGTQLQECPAGSICTSFGSAAQVCANICTGDGSCREGLQCNGVSGSNVKSCKPKG